MTSNPGSQVAEKVANLPSHWPMPGANDLLDYWVDAWQRSILLLDVLRQRGNNSREHNARTAPNVLSFDAELVLDGRSLPRPVNYGLVRIIPLQGTSVDPNKRPFIVFDPRAGHGPGIGGMKHDSEIGVALAAGHPCYFVGFLPDPVPGQTIEDVCEAEARFVEEVVKRHPNAEGKPCLIGNGQAGWQIRLMAAIHPERVGPLMLAGSPLSYWAGVHGKNPMRYLGGLLGGTWLTSLAGDLGNGIFDGANLVANFESLHPDNTYWKKIYNVYSHVDTEPPRFLEFEKWWGSPVLLNAEEMQSIADQLFVGNKLVSGELRSSNGTRVDLRNIKSPIIVFCSWGDDITPPQQALHWILDLYDHETEIVNAGQTIVYCLHHSVGHLGIFVSGKVATKEHEEFANAMDMIDLMPPGLYEAVITGLDETVEKPRAGAGWVSLYPRDPQTRRHPQDRRQQPRGRPCFRYGRADFGNQPGHVQHSDAAGSTRHGDGKKCRADAAHSSEPHALRNVRRREPVDAAGRGLGRGGARQPPSGEPGQSAPRLRAHDVGHDHQRARNVGQGARRRDGGVFFNTYGSPIVQAMVGMRAADASVGRRVGRDVAREAAAKQAAIHLEQQIDQGGLIEAAVRALIYVRLPEGKVDERGFAALKQISSELPAAKRVGFVRFKEIVKEQYLILLLDPERAIAALPKLLPDDRQQCQGILALVRRVLASRGPLPEEGRRRFERIEAIFAGPPPAKGREKAA